MSTEDVPSPIDLRDPNDAEAWASTAQQRAGRAQIFDAFATNLNALHNESLNVLELGSGPGFLACHLLDIVPGIQLTLLDFSEAMHDLARQRLTGHTDQVHYIVRDFKHDDWYKGLEQYDAVITNQAVHELRHKRHASKLHKQVTELLEDNGVYLVSDHFFGENGLKHDQLYMTLEEQSQALQTAGYSEVVRILVAGSLCLLQARL